MRYYASLTGDICTGVQQTTGQIIADNIIDITAEVESGTPSGDLLWRKRIGDGWSEEKYEPEIPTGPSDSERIDQLEAINATLLLDAANKDIQLADLMMTVAQLQAGGAA
ncbi:hypothetical protein [Cohnella sp. AR92]|uniref:hypothetical protein n=1 Tax=Cohnella sp. AR92 TaxID=648716 RepID=UPI000F8EDD54|nr:hypothetical protein [Cohnella sp. AR92]RUS42267.1 hypothetical protein ELR57_27020 [Cohnella sp. AR92]